MRSANLEKHLKVLWNNRDKIEDHHKALMLAILGIRPNKPKRVKRKEGQIICYQENKRKTESNAFVQDQILDIIKEHRIINRYKLETICQDKIICRGKLSDSIRKALFLLRKRGIIKIDRAN